ncbi:ABC transporter permease [Enterococcus florum]|uniref:ABC transporter permease n=1 Tax=Enterococcus florum TaxID=2480627 RepID=A0A4P5P7U9_9ENTE|nr:amino acid ABC transporter permease [Enterococcus florum]GCF94065.1 ABC transporter permease [Enterococcus florum]
MSFKLDIMVEALKTAVQYIGTTLFMAGAALIVGLVIGWGIALIRNYNIKGLSPLFQFLVTVLKGVPIVLVILGIFMLFSQQFNAFSESMNWGIRFKDIDPIWIVIFALSLMATINLSEVFRGALSSIKQGQYDAAKSIGLTTFQTIRRVLMPQVFPVALPMISNLLITLIKASALASMVSVVDVFAAAKITAQQNYRFLEAYVAVAIIYWSISLIIEKTSSLWERRILQRRGKLS